jgi:type IV pilus assembly protein PilM
MAFGRRNNGPRGVVGLDLDGEYISAVEVDGGVIRRSATADLPHGLIEEGEVQDGPGLTRVLSEFFEVNDLPRDVRLGVANQQISVRSLEIPHIEDRKERDAAIRFMAADAIAMPLDEAVLDHLAVGEVEAGDGTRRERVVVVAARAATVTKLVDCVKEAGLRAEGVDLNAFAMVRMLASGAEADQPAKVYCHLGDVVNLAIAVGSTCVFTRPLTPVRDESGAPGAAALADDIRLSIDFFMVQDGSHSVDQVLLSGPDAAREGLAQEIATSLGLPTEAAPPLANVDSGSLPPEIDPYRLTIAAGLAIGGRS